MAAVSRFIEFDANEETLLAGSSTTGKVAQGSRGYSRGTGLGTGDDAFTLVLGASDQLNVNINGVATETITLASGTALDPRFVARDIAFKLHSANADDAFKYAQCDWRNGGGPGPADQNSFIIYSGKLGVGTTNDVNVTAPARDATTVLGFDTVSEAAGLDLAPSVYAGDVTISGVYGGQFDDEYTALISAGETIEDGVPQGTNDYVTGGGVLTTDGIYTGTDGTYTITVDTTAGAYMGAYSGNVPVFTVSNKETQTAVELLYADHFYDCGVNGLRIKFSDVPFGVAGDVWDINCFAASGTAAIAGVAKYIFSSTRGDSSKSLGIGPLTTTINGDQLGSRGITIGWSNSGDLTAGDTFRVLGIGPQPLNSDVTQLNFGNVTVSTASATKVVWFELISGAIGMSTVKFSLQADGTFQHHDIGNLDTEFAFGTGGGGNTPPGGGTPTSNDQYEFSVDADSKGNITSADMNDGTPPNYLYATSGDLAVVSSADFAETLGNYQDAVVSDFVYLAIRLGANETGANSTINYRMFFDFS